ncbi:MAG: 30S ribosomal protein S12 methylthiotransferase RimO [Clostridiales bacterium]|nr:30S ribosomal protein S12 methylthiotransferase RimO [Candidatus Crickella equi]
MTKIYIDTLGCAKNEYDSQVLSADLEERGCAIVLDPEEADVLIVNTCGFIDDAKRESIEHIFEMAELKGESKKLVVTGCLSQRYHDELVEEMPEVDMFFGVNDYDVIPDIIVGDVAAPSPVGHLEPTTPSPLVYRKRMYKKNVYTDVLKIAEGCNNACAFCAIPAIRGPYRSKSIEDCVREARDMAEAGVKELVLIAQDTSQYGKDLYGSIKLPELLTELCKIDGIEWIRLQYVYDNGITDELIEVMKREPKICNYLDIPIQHIADNVLNAMRRRSSGKSIRATIKKLRDNIPDIHIRTTLLVGFPGETEADIEELIDFIDETKIDRLGAFAFSDEEGTASFDLPGKLDEETKQERRNMVMEHQLAVSEELNERKIGGVQEVMIDEVAGENLYIGRTRYDAPDIDCEVTVSTEIKHRPGDIIKVKITDSYEYDLEGVEV